MPFFEFTPQIETVFPCWSLPRQIRRLFGGMKRVFCIQRGGSPSGRDRILAGRLGSRAVELLRDDQGGLAVGERGNRIIEVPLSEVQKGEHAADTQIAELINVMAVMTKYK